MLFTSCVITEIMGKLGKEHSVSCSQCVGSGWILEARAISTPFKYYPILHAQKEVSIEIEKKLGISIGSSCPCRQTLQQVDRQLS